MAVFPLQYFTGTDALVRFNERYKSSPLNIKFAGQPKGVYIGFIPSTLGSVLTLSPDPTHGYSLVKVPSREDPGGMDVITTDPVTLDFTGQPDVDFPLLVIARARYWDDENQPTSASLVTRSGTAASVADDEVLVCVVNGPAASITAVNDPVSGQQDVPLAYSGVNFGYMPGGSIETLRAAADILNEVIAARTDLSGTTHPDLSTRLAVDYGATAMAGRLSLVFRALRSNDYAVTAGDEEVIVSGSFTEIDRDFLPAVTLGGEGSETQEGAIAGTNDATRNVVLIVDANTGYRLVDDLDDRRIIFGRLVGPNQSSLGGTWQFLNASKNVSETDGNGMATVESKVGDTIIGPDGLYYEIAAIITDNDIELRTAFQGASETISSPAFRRWRVEFKKMVAGTEEDAEILSNTTIRFFFPAFVTLAQSTADWTMAMHTAAEREPLPSASTSVPGLVRLADAGVLLGEVKIQNSGAPLLGGPFHTINFNAANASVVPSTTPGEVEVAEIGPQGAQGPDGVAGGPGDPGGPGPGFSQLNPWEESGAYNFPGINPPTPFSFTTDMGHNVRVLHGNVSTYRDFGFFGASGQDRLEIGGVSISGTEGTINGTIAGDTELRVFLSSAGD